jgi:tRNA(Ile2) C34 agmatinyltransferase TiaS
MAVARNLGTVVVTVAAVMRRGRPTCGKCGKELQHLEQWRCPWVACRVWLRHPERDNARPESLASPTSSISPGSPDGRDRVDGP